MIDCNDDSSSSEDETVKEASREATDQELLQNSLFNDKSKFRLNAISGSGKESTEVNVKPSSRLNSGRIGNFEIFGVSQSYKEFVAEKLYKLLRRNIELTEVIDVKQIEKKNRLKGIRLLLSSPDILTCHDEVVLIGAVRNSNQFVHEDPAADMRKCEEVAVNPESIISKTGTELWHERQRGTVFKYKKTSNGTLIEQS